MSQLRNNKNGMPLQIGAIGEAVPNSKDSNKDKTPENDEQEHIQRMQGFNKAPRNKLVGPPIIKSKVKPQETENDSVANGSCNGLSKRSKLYTSLNGQANFREKAGQQTKDKTLPVCKGSLHVNNITSITTVESHRSGVSTVQVSKGISMKRVNKVVESTGSKPSTISHVTARGSKVQPKSQSSGSRLDKRVNVGASVPKAKGKTKAVPSASSSSTQSSTQKLTPPSERSKAKSSVQKSLAHLEMTINPTMEVPSLKSSPLDTYKTLQEFLDMPEIQFPHSISNNVNKNYSLESEKPKPLFKSKFWDHIDPNKKDEDVRYRKNQDKEKPYDPVEVKSYMEKQKEIRKLKELREYDERQKELERKKQQLRELNEKCRSLTTRRSLGSKKSDTAPSLLPPDEDQESATQINVTKKFIKPKIRHSESFLPNGVEAKVKSAASVRREHEQESKKDLRATALLREFEHIVKKECMQVLQNHMNTKPQSSTAKSQSPNNSPRPVTYDKAVETTISLERNYNGYYSASPKNSSAVSSIADDNEFIRVASSSRRISHEQYNQAAARIQSAYRGYKIRKLLREANILPYLKHKKDPRSRRRMSFYRPPEKPFDSPMQRRCVSPARIPAYIPPQESLPGMLTSESRPSVRTLMPSLRLKPYDEPFPKEVIEKIQQSNQKLNELTKSTANTELYNRKSTENVWDANISSSDHLNSNFQPNPNHTWQKEPSFTFLEPQRQLSPFVTVRTDYLRNIEVPTPTIAEVFKEKLRTFSQDQQTKEALKETAPIKNNSDENVRNYVNSLSGYKYGSDLESTSDSYSHQEINGDFDRQLGKRTSPMRIYSPEIPESDSSDLKRRKSSKNRAGDRRISNGTHRRHNYEDSTTTVDTDADLVSNTSSKGFSLSDSEHPRVKSKSISEGRTSLTAKTTGTGFTTTTISPTTSSINIQSLPTPALELCYKAELERMEVIEKAYLVTVNYEKEQQLRKEELQKLERDRKWKEEHENEIKQKMGVENYKLDLQRNQQKLQNQLQSQIKILNESFPKNSDVNLALMSCQKDAVKATAELAKWMTELKKTSMEKDALEAKQQPVNLASMVYAAVDEARRRDDDRRRDEEKRLKRREMEKRRALKERELEKEREREKQKMKENVMKRNELIISEKEIEELSNVISVERSATDPKDISSGKNILTENATLGNEEESKSEISTGDAEEYEEELFEDEIISDNKEDEEALKLEAAKIVEELKRIENENVKENAMKRNELILSDKEIEEIEELSNVISIERSSTVQEDISLEKNILTENVTLANEEESKVEINTEDVEEYEEELFEDEMISDNKDEEALKLEAAKIVEEQNRIENVNMKENAMNSNELILSEKEIEEIEELSNVISIERSAAVPEDVSLEKNILTENASVANEEKSKVEISTEDVEEYEEELFEDETISDNKEDEEGLKLEAANIVEEQNRIENENIKENAMKSNELILSEKEIEEIEELSNVISNERSDTVPEDISLLKNILTENASVANEEESKFEISTEDVEEYDEEFFEDEIISDKKEDEEALKLEAANEEQNKIEYEKIKENGLQKNELLLLEKEIEEIAELSNVISIERSATVPEDISLEKNILTENATLANEEESKNEISTVDVEEYEEELFEDETISDKKDEEDLKLEAAKIVEEQNHIENEIMKENELILSEKEIEEFSNVISIERSATEPEDISLEKNILTENVIVANEEESKGEISTEDVEEHEEEMISDNKEDEEALNLEDAKIVDEQNIIENENMKENSMNSNELIVSEKEIEEKEELSNVISNETSALVPEDILVEKNILTGNAIIANEEESKGEISTEDIEEVEEEWFEDEMISDDKEDEEALKLEAAKIVEEQTRIEDEIRALETLQAQAPSASRMSMNLGLSDIPVKPPPPYSPPSSDSYSLSRSCVISITENKVEECVTNLVEEIWDTWVQAKVLHHPREHLNFSSKSGANTAVEEGTPSKTKFRSMHQSANESFDSLLSDFVQQTIEQVLLVDEDWKSYIDKVRPGPMALQAQLMRLPKTKEALIETVLAITQENVPQLMLAAEVSKSSSTALGPAQKKRLTKWSSRPRDQVDEVLVQELIEEDREWTEFWPEELVVVDQTCKKTIQRCIRDILSNLRTAIDNE